MTPPSRQRIQGFTLLEVLLSLLLLSLLLAAVYAGIATSLHLVHGGMALANRQDQILASQRFLRQSLAQIRALSFADGPAGSHVLLQGGPHQLSYVAPLGGALAAGGLQIQQLQLVAARDGWRLELQRRPWRVPAGTAPGPAAREVLLDRIRTGRFAYRDRDRPEQAGHWQSQWTDRQRLPQLIRLELQLGDGQHWPSLVVPLRIDVEAGAEMDIAGWGGP